MASVFRMGAATMEFHKYHALGNDYLVMNPAEVGRELTEAEVVRICHRHYGIGSDGILWGPMSPGGGDKPFALRIYNPDGSIAEKSGNGLRIYSRYLWDHGFVGEEAFQIFTDGGVVTSEVHKGGRTATVDMGRVTFDGERIPVVGGAREVLEEEIEVGGEILRFSAASVGNPHCVVLRDEVTKEDVCRLGALLEVEERFPNRTNVQFVKVVDRSTIQIEIWERGAGYTLASGSSSSAAAAVAHKLGHCDSEITVRMPGGEIGISIGADFAIRMVGGVTRVGSGFLREEVLA